MFEELEAREAAARDQVVELDGGELADLTGRLEKARETLERLRIARETVAEVMAEMSADALIVPDAEPDIAQASGDETASSYAGALRRAVGVLTVSKWQAGMGAEVLPRAYRSILEVVQDAPGPVRAKPGTAETDAWVAVHLTTILAGQADRRPGDDPPGRPRPTVRHLAGSGRFVLPLPERPP